MAGRELSPAGRSGHAGPRLRFLLGLAQVDAIGCSVGLLLSSGLTTLTLAAVAISCALTGISLLRGRGGPS